jgi:hypothetical protein
MTRLWKNRKGSAYLWALFILLAMVILAAVVYNGVAVYVKYQTAETELQRAATVTVDASMQNAAVRDLILDVPTADAETLFFKNLRESGYQNNGSEWTKRIDDKTVYTLTELETGTDGCTMKVTAILSLPLMWDISGMSVIRVPIQVLSSMLYIQP